MHLVDERLERLTFQRKRGVAYVASARPGGIVILENGTTVVHKTRRKAKPLSTYHVEAGWLVRRYDALGPAREAAARKESARVARLSKGKAFQAVLRELRARLKVKPQRRGDVWLFDLMGPGVRAHRPPITDVVGEQAALLARGALVVAGGFDLEGRVFRVQCTPTRDVADCVRFLGGLTGAAEIVAPLRALAADTAIAVVHAQGTDAELWLELAAAPKNLKRHAQAWVRALMDTPLENEPSPTELAAMLKKKTLSLRWH